MKTNNYVLDYMPLADSLAWKKAKITPKSVDIDELKSAAYLGLTQAAISFDPNFGVEFATHAIPRIKGAMGDYLRELQWGPKSMQSLDLPIGEETLGDTVIQKNQSHEITILDGLEDRSKEIVSMYYIEGFTLKEIGSKIGVKESRVSQLLSETRNRLQQRLKVCA